MADADWKKFEKKAQAPPEQVASGTTKSFKDIPLFKIYSIEGARLVTTCYGTRVIVTIADKSGEFEDRWAFPNLQKMFEKDGQLKPKSEWPAEIGFKTNNSNYTYVFTPRK